MLRSLRSVLVVAAVMLASVGLAAPASAATLTVSQYEDRIATLVNQARADAGVAPLTVSGSVSAVSRAWSQTMASTAVFAHNPSYQWQMPSGWSKVAENIAYGAVTSGQYSADSIHANLYNSAGHRANILDPAMTHLGVGVAFVTRGGYSYVYVTENFGKYTGAGPAPTAADLDLPFQQIVMTKDMTGDGYGDVLGVDLSGRLALYCGSKTGAVALTKVYGTGWGALDVYAPGDWNGDGRSDVVATNSAGDLLLYAGKSGAGLASGSKIGNGWNGYRIVPAGDVNGDKRADLLAIDGLGKLWLYPGNGKGGFGNRLNVGNGWGSFDLYAGGDMNRDGRVDILGVDAAGKLWYYAGRGGGFFSQKIQVGNGWSTYTFASGADINKDGIGDLLGRDSSGKLYFYPGRVGGSFGTKVLIGTGW